MEKEAKRQAAMEQKQESSWISPGLVNNTLTYREGERVRVATNQYMHAPRVQYMCRSLALYDYNPDGRHPP